jgi:uncharacterized membrane protein YjjB (DUF3815 family)
MCVTTNRSRWLSWWHGRRRALSALKRASPNWIESATSAGDFHGLGAMLYFGPPTSFLPWMLLTAYAGQWVGNAVLGSYANGIGGGPILIICALAISHRPNTPPTVSLVLPGFWLLVPGSLGFMGVTQLLGTHSTAVFTATLISMMSIAVGVQTGLLPWRTAIQLTSSPNKRAMHD